MLPVFLPVVYKQVEVVGPYNLSSSREDGASEDIMTIRSIAKSSITGQSVDLEKQFAISGTFGQPLPEWLTFDPSRGATRAKMKVAVKAGIIAPGAFQSSQIVVSVDGAPTDVLIFARNWGQPVFVLPATDFW